MSMSMIQYSSLGFGLTCLLLRLEPPACCRTGNNLLHFFPHLDYPVLIRGWMPGGIRTRGRRKAARRTITTELSHTTPRRLSQILCR
jgi:hypothetical protein